MNKEEFDKNFKLVENYMIKAPKEIEKAYKFLRADYVNQLKNNQNAIKYFEIFKELDSCIINGRMVEKGLNILKGNEKINEDIK